jgi:hypothetical protein
MILLTEIFSRFIQFVKQPGVTVDPGAIIAILSLDDPSRVKKAKPFEGMIPDMGLPNVLGTKSHQQLAAQLASIHDILDGFEADNANAILRALHESLKNPELAFGEALSILSTLSGRMPADLEDDIRESITLAQQKPNAEFPAQKVRLPSSYSLTSCRSRVDPRLFVLIVPTDPQADRPIRRGHSTSGASCRPASGRVDSGPCFQERWWHQGLRFLVRPFPLTSSSLSEPF